MLTLSQFGENPCVMGRTHQNCQLPSFLTSLLNHLFFQKVVEVVIYWKGKSMGNLELARAPNFGMSCFACMDKKTQKLYVSLDPYIHVLDSLSLLRAARGSHSFSIHHSPPSSFSCKSDIVVAAKLFLCVSFMLYECLMTL